MLAQIQNRIVASAVPDRASVQTQRIRRDADPVSVSIIGLDLVVELQMVHPVVATYVTKVNHPRGRTDIQRQLGRAGDLNRLVESNVDLDCFAESVRVSAHWLVDVHPSHNRRVVDAAVHLVVPRRRC